jgi:hypothetical protein
LDLKESYKILGLAPGASEKQIKGAYRKLAFRYHPDRNPSREAKQKFEEATEAYHMLMDIKEQPPGDSPSREEWVASEILQRERERMRRQARARREKIKQQEDYFKRPEWHDPILFLRYFLHLVAILFAAAAILMPVLYAIFVDPASLAGGVFFIIVGIFSLVYIYQHRKSWLRLGKFKTTREDIFRYIRPQPAENATERCCYTKNSKADGKPYRIELVKTIDIKIRSFGALNHEARYKNRVRKVVVPRSLRAQLIHRFSTLAKILCILIFLLFFPVESLLWRFIAGLLAGTMLSFVVLVTTRVRSRISYLLTPGLLIKGLVWIGALLLISDIGPGFNIRTSGLIYIVIFGLFFLLDMVFDLVMGMFPFYRRLFRPLIKQGPVLESLYNEGYQNYMELPVYSVIYPLFKWIF